jgi:hypothetical protein
VGVVPGSVDRDQAHGGQAPAQRGGDLDVIPGYRALAEYRSGMWCQSQVGTDPKRQLPAAFTELALAI